MADETQPLIGRILLSPWTTIAGMAAGIAVGILWKDDALKLAPYGQIYLSLLSMCAYPIIITAISTSIAGLVRTGGAGNRTWRIALMIMAFMLGTALLGVAAGMIGQPGRCVTKEAKAQMSGIIEKSDDSAIIEMNLRNADAEKQVNFTVSKFLSEAVSPNIFESLSQNRNLQVLFFSILFGIALGALGKDIATPGISALETFYHAFIKIIKWAMYPLPFGIFCLVGVGVAKVGVEILAAMTGFLVAFFVAGLLYLAFCMIVVWRKSGVSFRRSLVMMKDPIIIAVGTQNSIATIPSLIETMSGPFRFNEEDSRLLIPLAVTMGRLGNVLYFSLIGVFVAQLYGMKLGGLEILLIVLCSILAGLASSGTTGVLTLSLSMMVLDPLHLPWEAVLTLLIAVEPIANPLRTLLTTYPACAFTALLTNRPGGKKDSVKGKASCPVQAEEEEQVA